MEMDIGISERDRASIADGLSRVLADTYALYVRTHGFHWNVTGPSFRTLHLMFEEQYEALAIAVDELAERIRALGFPAPGTFKQFQALSSLPPEEDKVPEASVMIRTLVKCHEAVTRTARKAFHVAEAADDQPTCDLLTVRMNAHEKAAWMLRSLVEHQGETTAKPAKDVVSRNGSGGSRPAPRRPRA